MKSPIWTLVGFILLAIGFLSFILGMVGLSLDYLAFLDSVSPVIKLLVQICMMFGGVIVMYVSKTSEEE